MNYLPITILGMVFLGVAFAITEKNAKYLLSGFNTLSKEKQQEFNLRDYLAYFKKFHVFLGVSILLIGLLIELLIGKNASLYFLFF